MSVGRVASLAIAALLALFFAFVGGNKAFAPLADLARHGAWTVHLPEALGRVVGWSEMILAAALLVPRTRVGAALALVVNQIVATGVHLAHGETAALPQNAVLIAALGLVAALSRRRHLRSE